MYKIGVVGTGIIAKDHTYAIERNEDCELVAVCDVVEEKARECAGEGVLVFTDYKKMADEVDLDAVILNLPHFLHCEVSVFFLERGINVLCEKPMANSVKECDKMIAASKKSGAKLAIGHVQRYFEAYNIVKEYIHTKELGKLTRITETRTIDYFPNRPKWFLKKELAGGGICLNYGAHSLDKIFYATGLDVVDVHGCLSNKLTDDNIEAGAQILFELSDGASAMVNYCGCHVPTVYETVFYFTDGAVKTTGYGNDVWVAKDKEYKKVEVADDGRTYMEKQLCEFVKMLGGQPNMMVTAEYGRKVIEVLEKMYAKA